MAERPRRATNCCISSLEASLESLDKVRFRDLAALDIVGIYPNYAEAYRAWKEKAQMTVDNAQTRYFIVHLHRLLEPETGHGNS